MKRRNVASKLLVLLLVLSLTLVGVIGGTLAWLMTKTDSVVNTFTYGNIKIDLEETDPEDDDDPSNNTFPMVPGNPIAKDPKVTVKADSEDCWLFVKIDESANLDDFITYVVAGGWAALDEETYPGVYYRRVDKSEEDVTFSVLAGDEVTVKETVTKDMLEALDKTAETNYPKLTFTAYAVQRDGEFEAIATAESAWQLVLADQAENA